MLTMGFGFSLHYFSAQGERLDSHALWTRTALNSSPPLDLLPLPFPHTLIGGLGSKITKDRNVFPDEYCTD